MNTWQNAILYEVNLRQYTEAGTFRAFMAHLPRLREMGVTALWFMPIYPISQLRRKGSLGSPYAIQDYTSTNPDLGTMEDFRALVNACHAQGMQVLLDWVANHTGPDHSWTKYPSWYRRDAQGVPISAVEDWTDAADLLYAGNDAVETAMLNAMKFWVRECDIDGFRCDVASMVSASFWKKAIGELNKLKPLFWLAEADDAAFEAEAGFEAGYDWGLYRMMDALALGEKHLPDFWVYVQQNALRFPSASLRLRFTSNHDENAWQGSEYERMKNAQACQAMAALTFMLPGLPLIYSGQEDALSRKLAFFDKDPIQWQNFSLHFFYQTLCRLRRNHPALASTPNSKLVQWVSPANILAFARKHSSGAACFFVLNPQKEKAIFPLISEMLAGTWRNVFTQETRTFSRSESFELAAWQYQIWEKI